MKKNIFVLSAIAVAMGVAAANVWQLQDNKTGAVLPISKPCRMAMRAATRKKRNGDAVEM